MDGEARRKHASSFDRAAQVYAQSRPGYPTDAARWLVGASPRDVLDLGAGAGALTVALERQGHRVVSADPSHAMLSQLCGAARDSPGGEASARTAVQAVAEALPFRDASFDTVTVAQAFHWFDHRRALPSVAQVLRPAGALGVVYNTQDEGTAWVRELGGLLRSAQPAGLTGDWGAGSTEALAASDLFGPAEVYTTRWSAAMTRDRLVGLVESRSYVISLDNAARCALLAEVRALFDRTAAGAARVELPYVTQCWRVSKVT